MVIILYLELVKNYLQIKINKPLALPHLIATVVSTIAYSPPMDLMTMAFVSPGNKKEDHVVETWILSIKNNVILHANVDILTVIILHLELVKNYPRIKINNKPLALPQMTVIQIQTTVCSHPMYHMIMDVVSLGNKKEDHAVEIWILSIKNNVILPANVDIRMVITLCLELVKNYLQIKINNKPLALPHLIAMAL